MTAMVLKIMKTYGIVFLVAFAAIFFSAGFNILIAADTPAKLPGIQILINKTSQINQGRILLGQIASIRADDFLSQALAKIDLGPSPKPDKIKLMDQKKIASAIQGEQYIGKDVEIVFPDKIYVKRLGQKISKNDIQKFINEHLSKRFGSKEYKLVSLKVRGLETYPEGMLEYTLAPDDMIGKNGRIAFFLKVKINGEIFDKLSVTGKIEVYEDVLCVTRSFPRGQILNRDDLYFKKVNIFDLSDDYIKGFEQLDQKSLKVSMKKGEYLRTSLLEKPPLIQKGDMVTLVSKNDSLLIVTSGISKEDGFANEVIRVENLNSGKLVRGVVRDKLKVEVGF